MIGEDLTSNPPAKSKAARAVILLVEDNVGSREAMGEFLRLEGYTVVEAANATEALRQASAADLLLTDLRLPGIDGIELMEMVRQRVAGLPAIVITGFASIDTAVDAIRKGAYQYLTKPVDPEHLVCLVERALEEDRLRREVRRLRAELESRYGFSTMIGQSEKMREIYERIRRVAPTQTTVLITGESGTGKELVARAVHRLSQRADQPFVAVNCAALSPTLVESELFGHEKGAFTGAARKHEGLFFAANTGTILIDEIGDLALELQAKLLRVLEQHEVTPVGSTRTRRLDVRVVASTHVDLVSAVEEGKFREDLYYRLSVVTIHIPPLRERIEDIPLLVSHFLETCRADVGGEARAFSDAALNKLMAYNWPGNVRELRNVVEGLVVLTPHATIDVEDLPARIRGVSGGETSPARLAGLTLDKIERMAIEQTLELTGSNRTQAAKILGIGLRTLQRKLKVYSHLDERGEDDGGDDDED